MIKKWIAGAAIAASLTVGTGAQAALFDSALSSLTGSASHSTVYGEKRYKTRTLDGIAFGGASARVAQKTYSLVRYDPFHISAGCAGIDFHLGGLAWINGDQIKAMLSTISQGAGYVLFQIAMNALMPELAQNLSKAAELLQKATQFNIDSCEASTALASGIASGAAGLMQSASPDDGMVSGFASRLGDASGTMFRDSCSTLANGLLGGPSNINSGGFLGGIGTRAQGWQDAMQGACAKPEDWAKTMKDAVAGAQGDEILTLLESTGNPVWSALTLAGFGANQSFSPAPKSGSTMVDFMSKLYSTNEYQTNRVSDEALYKQRAVLGQLVYSWVGGLEVMNETDAGVVQGAPKSVLNTEEMMSFMLCGNPANIKGTSELPEGATLKQQLDNAAGDICRGLYTMGQEAGTAPQIPIIECHSADCSEAGHDNNNDVCLYASGECSGYITEYMDEHEGLMFTVANELSEAVSLIAGNYEISELQKDLIIAAPFPLWQAVNIAALNPELASDLLVGNAHMLAVMIAGSYINQASTEIRTRFSSSKIPTNLARVMNEAANKMSRLGERKYQDLMRLYATQSEIMETVKTANKAITQEAFSSGITGADFARAINGG